MKRIKSFIPISSPCTSTNSTINESVDLLEESKRANNICIVFLSASAEKITKSSNSMYNFKQKCEEKGFKFIVIDPSISKIDRADSNNEFVVTEKDHEYHLSITNTIIVPRRTVLKNSESRDFLLLLQGYGFFCFNTMDSFESCEDKFITYRKLVQNDVPTPRTAILTPSNMDRLEKKVDSIGGQFPIVCKILNGTQGIGVFIIDSMVSLKSTLQTLFKLSPKSDILIQEKIDSDYDLRIHVVYDSFDLLTNDLTNYKIIGCMQRNKLSGDFRSNYSLGSTAEKGHITDEQKEIAKKAAKACNCRWAGVDLIIDKKTKKPYVIEVNSSPGTKGITTAAGDDVVDTILTMFKDFKYTNYSSNVIGTYETGTIGTLDNKDVILKSSNEQSMTQIRVKGFKVDEKQDNITIVFNSETYKVPLTGFRGETPLIELTIKFNGVIYRNEICKVVKAENEGDFNCIEIGSRFLQRVGSSITISPQSWILTDNILDFHVPDLEKEE